MESSARMRLNPPLAGETEAAGKEMEAAGREMNTGSH
jgi:hypothetical protein